jgi:antitoxin MazE
MQLSVIKIGNSKGIRLPKKIVEDYNLVDKVELILEKESVTLKPIKNPRQGWDEIFKKESKNDNGTLLIDDVFDDEDFEEWK